MGTLKYKGYTGSVEYSDEDKCLYGKVLGLNKVYITYEGDSIPELQEDFEGAIDTYLQGCAERGVAPSKPYSGRFVIRMSSDLHSKVAMAAAESGTTINDFINRVVSREVEMVKG
ncbi:MAG: type II toxin-antitoxin system HicB family antitoxin [Bacteroidaceae bacterium]|nr:type II toxin-antitoxin system HicB family antitoxin [Bacteroidaceae bacterium]